MRRMYSEQELTKIIKEVSEAYIDELIEDGEFDQEIADYVDAYLVEHPVDITALEGQDIAPKDIAATGDITAPSIIESMSGYIFHKGVDAGITYDFKYAGVVKNGNKITFAIVCSIIRTASVENSQMSLGYFTIPSAIGNKLIPAKSTWLDFKKQYAATTYNTGVEIPCLMVKNDVTAIANNLYDVNTILELNTEYFIRYEVTFLLSENLAA